MGASRLISFKRDECIEYLDEHIDKMIEYYERLYAGTSWNKITSRRLGISPEVVDTANRIAIVYHDLGKAFFQEQMIRDRGARYHECFSVLLLQETRHNLMKYFNGLTEEVYLAVTWSIIVHHLSLRGNSLTTCLLIKPPISYRALPEDRARILSQIIRDRLGVDVSIRSGVYRLASLRDTIARRLSSNVRKVYPLALRITRVLITTDTLAAQDLRCSKDYRVYVADIPSPEAMIEAKRVLVKWLQS